METKQFLQLEMIVKNGNSFFLLLMLVMLFSCVEKDERIPKEIFNKYDVMRKTDYSGLLNITIRPRGKHNNGLNAVPYIYYNRFNGDVLKIPNLYEYKYEVFGYDTVPTDILSLAKIKMITDEDPFEYAHNYCKKVLQLYRKSEAIEINSNPELGAFIIFEFPNNYDLIYLADKDFIQHDYWKKFFKTERKIDDNWYYRETKTN